MNLGEEKCQTRNHGSLVFSSVLWCSRDLPLVLPLEILRGVWRCQQKLNVIRVRMESYIGFFSVNNGNTPIS